MASIHRQTDTVTYSLL